MADVARVSGNDSNGDQVFVSHLLKEWAITIDALYSGDLMLLLRKGGIKDPARPFAVPHQQALLFPTYEHQITQSLKAQSLKTAYLQEASLSNAQIYLKAWVNITHCFALNALPDIEALMPFHIWTSDFITERLKWQPQQPLQVLCVRTYRLAEPIILARSPNYSGCRSWITLQTPICVDLKDPAISEDQYHEKLSAIEASLQLHSTFTIASFKL
jgi:hypothetical protein